MSRTAATLASIALCLLGAACTGPLLDSPPKARQTDVFLPPLFSSSSSPDGSSHEWSAFFWLAGHSVESTRTHSRLLPFWWHDAEPPYSENTLLFPLYYSKQSAVEDTRFFTPLYGWVERNGVRGDYVLGPVMWRESDGAGYHRSSILFLYDWRHEGERDDLTLLSLLGLVTGFRMESGLPPDGETVPALGREHSRHFEVANLFGLVTAFGYDDVGDRREVRVLTLLSSEALSPIRSWRGRGDNPFVHEWLFPLYMNMHDAQGDGWLYVGPLWGEINHPAAGTATDWWLLGLLSRTEGKDGKTWRVAGIPVSGP